MKQLLIRLLLSTAILAPLLAPAELVLYKGARRDTCIGEGHSLATRAKLIFIVDHQTAQTACLHYVTVNGFKRYALMQWTNTHFVQITSERGSYTALTRPPTACEKDGGANGEAVYCSGPNTTLTINTHSTVFFPRTWSGYGGGLAYSPASGRPILNEGSFFFVFDRAGTLASNQAAETLDSALARLTAHLESLGYSR